MILDLVTETIRVVLEGAVTLNELEWTASWADHDPVGERFTPAGTHGLTNGTTPVDVITSPSANVQRQAKMITVFNSDTADATVVVQKFDGTVTRRWIRALLEPNWSLQWEPGGTWHVYDENGILQIPVGGGGGGGATFFGGMSTGGNTSGNSGVVSGRMVLAGGNNITLSGSTNGASISITISAPNQSNQILSGFALNNTTGQSSSSTLDARSLSFDGRGNVSVGFSAGAVVISGGQSNQQMTLFATGNTTQSSSGTSNASSLIFRGEGIASVGITNGSVVLSVPSPAAQTNQTVGFYALQNTTAQSSSSTWDARSMSFAGMGIVSLGNSAGSGLVISATQSNQAFSAAGGSSAFQTLSFSDNANASWTNNAGQVALTSLRASLFATSNTTQGTSGTANLHSLIFAGAGVASVGVTDGSVVISVPSGGGAGDGGVFAGVSTMGNTAGSTGTVSTGNFVFVGSNGISLSQSTGAAGSAATVTIDAGVLSKWRRADAMSVGASNAANSSASIIGFVLDCPVAASNVLIAGSVSAATQTNTSSAGYVIGWSGVFYTRSGSTLSSINSFSNSTSTFHQSNSTLSVADRRIFTANLASSSLFSMGEYWLMLHVTTTTSGQTSLAKGLSMGLIPSATGVNAIAPANYLGGSVGANSRAVMVGNPATFSTGATRASVAFSDVVGYAAVANVWFELRNYTIW